MKRKRRLLAMLLCCGMLFGMHAGTQGAGATDIPCIKTFFAGEKSAAAWTTAVTVELPDDVQLQEDAMVRVVSKGNGAPALALSSWSGGAAWATVQPRHNLDGALYYAYADMVQSFGAADLSLVDSLSVTAQGAAITVYELSLVDAAAVEAADQPAMGGGRRVVGYLPDWSYGCFATLDFSALTHLNIAFCNPDPAGQFSCSIPDAAFHEIVARAHASGVKVLASLGGAGGSGNYPALVATAESRKQLNKNLLAYCRKYDLDGIDLDIEGDVDAAFWPPYEDWCLSLRSLCDADSLLLTTATAQWVSRHVSDTAFACFDFLNIMAYDNDTDPVSHASYDFAEASLSYFRIQRGIARDKLVLGVPFYGRGYHADGSLDWSSYVSFRELLRLNPANYQRDVYAGIAFNGSKTIQKKCELALQYGGMMIWELSQDATGETSLLRIIRDRLRVLPGGDANGDGVVNCADLVLLQRYLLGERTLTADAASRMDVQTDGVLNGTDLWRLKSIMLSA